MKEHIKNIEKMIKDYELWKRDDSKKIVPIIQQDIDSIKIILDILKTMKENYG